MVDKACSTCGRYENCTLKIMYACRDWNAYMRCMNNLRLWIPKETK